MRRIITEKLTSGELDECDLTTHDLDQIRNAFVEMLHGVFHPRIKYPEEVKQELASGERAALPLPESVPVATSTPTGEE